MDTVSAGGNPARPFDRIALAREATAAHNRYLELMAAALAVVGLLVIAAAARKVITVADARPVVVTRIGGAA